MSNLRDRTVALAGIYQAAEIAQSLARTGRCDNDAIKVMIASLLRMSADDTLSVYGGVEGVASGLVAIRGRIVTQAEIADFELGRYVFSLMQLAGRLRHNAPMASVIQDRVNELAAHGVTFDATLQSEVDMAHGRISGCEDVFAFLAETYSETISHLVPQIIVHGEHGYLADEVIVNRVRTSLLAGVRSAYLWTQLGGRKWHLIFQKRTYVEQATQLLAETGDAPIA